MYRIVIVGTSGAGKTTLAKELAHRLNIRHVWLDELAWMPDWEFRPYDELASVIEKATSDENWLIDGNFQRFQYIYIENATHLVWLNYSFPVIFGRCLRRTIRRAWTREKLFNGENRESFYKSFFHKDSILIWVFKTFWKHRREYPQLFDKLKDSNIKTIELRNQRETDNIFNLIKSV